MSGAITEFDPTSGALTEYQREDEFIPIEPVYPRWRSFVSQSAVRALAVAPNSRRLWIGTWGGVHFWDVGQRAGRYTSEHGLPGNGVACLCLDRKERLWVAGMEGGLCWFDDNAWHLCPDVKLRGKRVLALCADDADGVFAATAAMVYQVSAQTGQAELMALSVSDATVDAACLVSDGARGVLLGSPWGLHRLRPDEEPERLYADSIEQCTALARDAQGGLWIGTHSALYWPDGEGLSGVLPPQLSPPAGPILALAVARSRVWTLFANGLAYWENGQWTPVAQADDNVPGRAITCSDDSLLWVGTDQGIRRVDAPVGTTPCWRLDRRPPVYRDDTLQNTTRTLAVEGDRLWVGGAGKLIAFDGPDEWQEMDEAIDVRSVCVDRDGKFWLLAWPDGLRSGGDAPEPLLGLPLLLAVGHDPQVKIGCLTGRGLWQLTLAGWMLHPASLPATPVCLAQSADSNWWLGCSDGLYYLAEKRWAPLPEGRGPAHSSIRALAVVNDLLWVAGDQGLWAQQAGVWMRYQIGPQAHPLGVRALLATANSRLWLATDEALLRYDPATHTVDDDWRFTLGESGLAGLRVHALAEKDGYLWIATSSGISRLRLEE